MYYNYVRFGAQGIIYTREALDPRIKLILDAPVISVKRSLLLSGTSIELDLVNSYGHFH